MNEPTDNRSVFDDPLGVVERLILQAEARGGRKALDQAAEAWEASHLTGLTAGYVASWLRRTSVTCDEDRVSLG